MVNLQSRVLLSQSYNWIEGNSAGGCLLAPVGAEKGSRNRSPTRSLVIFQEWGLIDLPLRAITQSANLFSRVAWSILECARRTRVFQFPIQLLGGVAKAALYCAHRTSTVSPCAFCEQEGHLAASPLSPYLHPSPFVPPPKPPKFPPKPPWPVPQYSPF